MANHSRKQIKAVVEIGPNYAFHLMAAARVGFDSEYADKYLDSVSPEDIAFLQKHRKLITFGGVGCDLVDIIPGLPAIFNLDTQEALQEYFSLLANGTNEGDFSPFLKKYEPALKKLEVWIGAVIDEKALKPYEEYREIIAGLGKITVKNFNRYIDKVWKKEEPQLAMVASKINDYFLNIDRIGQWERLTGLQFKFDVYQIVLCAAIKNGPDANSIGYDRVIFYNGSPVEEIIQLISHEIGTHLTIDDFMKLARQDRFPYPELYEAMECLAHYYNTIILENSELAYAHKLKNFHTAEYAEIYRQIQKSEPKLTPYELMEKGIKTYQARSETP